MNAPIGSNEVRETTVNIDCSHGAYGGGKTKTTVVTGLKGLEKHEGVRWVGWIGQGSAWLGRAQHGGSVWSVAGPAGAGSERAIQIFK